MPRALRIALWSLVVIVPAAAALLPLPYYGFSPGPARDVAPLIRFDELERFDSGGRFVLTTVRRQQLTPLTALRVWLDDARHALPEDEVFPPDLDPDEEEALSLAQMDQSQIHAAWVVLSRLTDYPRDHAPGALVDGTYPSCPADGMLFPGEVITAIDGEPIGSLDEARDAIDAAGPGEQLSFDIVSGDARREVTLSREQCVEDQDEPVLGVSLVAAFPVDIDIESADVGGPSAGLMFAVGLYDLLTPGDLTDGATVAGTGDLQLDGTVLPIGGIRDKVLGAEAVGASLFLVPRENLGELQGMDTGEMRVVAVDSFGEALEVLLDAGGADEGEAVPLTG